VNVGREINTKVAGKALQGGGGVTMIDEELNDSVGCPVFVLLLSKEAMGEEVVEHPECILTLTNLFGF